MTVPPITQIMSSKDKAENAVLNWWCTQWRALLSELISTMMLLIFGCMTCIPVEGLTGMPPMYTPFGFGLTVMFNIQIFGHISGAYMNPAITLASVIWGSTPIVLGIAFTIMQCIGATLGYGVLVALSPIDILQEGLCTTLPHSGLNALQAFGIEIVLTAALTLINCGLWDPVNKDRQDGAPIKFGLTVAGLSLAGGHLTGASMNPARTLGPAVWTQTWTIHWVYWAGPFVGAALPALFYKYVWLKKKSIE